MKPNEITWILTVDKANMILAMLAQQPYERVAPLIDELREQAQPQVSPFQGGQQRANGEARETGGRTLNG